MLKIAYSPIYKYTLPAGHRFPMEKYELLPEQLLHEGTVTSANFFAPKRLSETEILWTHTSEYWEKLKTQRLSRKEARPIGFPMSKALVERGRVIAHGTIECCLHAMEHGVSMNIAGGTHHAYADHGEGFCVFNDFAIAANYLFQHELVKQILIVDLDVHQGNGNAKIFQHRPEVFTFSMHGAKNYPLRKEKSDLDIALPDQCDDSLYLRLLHEALPALIDRVQPDLILYQSGVDVLESDKLGRLSMSRAGCRQRDEFVFSTAHRNNIPVAVSMGGGYSPRIADIIDAHANTFRMAQQVFF
ncbi:MAG: histone deacetylase [Saprospiraceae bacterium]|nr:histone deacetylase [Saprospiraceae bacterium]